MNTSTVNTLLLIISASLLDAQSFGGFTPNQPPFHPSQQPYGSPVPVPNSPFPPYYNYCEAGKMQAQTYQPIPNAQLVHVQVATRHGDRTATSAILPADQENWDCTESQEVLGIHTSSKHDLKSVRIKYDLPKDHIFRDSLWKGSCLDGQLTPKGVKQHVKLGKELRHIYVDKLKFLNKNYHKDQVWARATDRPRTRLSAIALMDGLYPSQTRKGRDDVLLHVQPLDWDKMKSHEEKCPKLVTLTSSVKKAPIMTQHVQQGKQILNELNTLLQTSDAKKLQGSDLVGFQDVLITRYCHNKQFPSPMITVNTLKRVQAYVTRYNEIKHYHTPASREMNRLSYGPFIGEMRDYILKVVNGQSIKKFQLLSGHDNTLYGLMAGLGMVKEEFFWPPYASNFVVELWRTNAGGPRLYRRQYGYGGPTDGFGQPTGFGQQQANLNGYVVRIIYNGRPFHSTLCDFANGCPLTRFLQICDQAVPSNYPMECSTDGRPVSYRIATARTKDAKESKPTPGF